VLSELISARYERRSILITANPVMTLAAVDRLVHRDNLRAECRELSAARGDRAKARTRQAGAICDTR
jgi:hypothetical protein